MSKIGVFETSEILRIARMFMPDAELAPEEGWRKDGNNGIEFDDSCGCYSEWTVESCSLDVLLKGTLKGDGYEQARSIENALEKWSKGSLEWSGCECCDESLSIFVRLFRKLRKGAAQL